MAGTTIKGSTSNEYIDAQIVWYSTANKSANTSSVTAALYYKRNNTGHTTSGTGTFSITIDGVTKSASKTVSITENSWVKVVENTVTVNHNYNGRRTITISGAGSIPSTSLSATSISAKVDLDVIPRETTFDYLSCATKYFNGKITYKFTPQSPDLYNRCQITINDTHVKYLPLGKQSASLHTGSLTLDETDLTIIYNKLPSSTKGTLRFTFTTYTDVNYSDAVGSGQYKEISLEIPLNDKTQPTATIDISPSHSIPDKFKDWYIRGKSKVKASITDVTGKYGATVKTIKMTVLGKTYSHTYTSGDVTIVSPVLNVEGNSIVQFILTDSRGFSTTYSRSITVLPYAPPIILPANGEDEIVCARCDANGNFDDSGTFLRIKAKRSYSKVNVSGVDQNLCYIRYRYKAEGGSYSAWITILPTTASSDEIVTGALLGTLDVMSTYLVQIAAVDTIGEMGSTIISLPTERVYMHKAASMNSLGIGKYAEEANTVDIAEDMLLKVRGELSVRGDKVSDLPVEVGTNGIWTYRKWQSGIAECWCRRNVDVNVTTAWGSSLFHGVATSIDYPFTFAEAPICQTTCEYGADQAALLITSYGSSTTSYTPRIMFCRPDAKTVNCNLLYHVCGRWK